VQHKPLSPDTHAADFWLACIAIVVVTIAFVAARAVNILA